MEPATSAALLDKLSHEIQDFFDNPTSVSPTVTAAELRQHLSRFTFDQPLEAETVFDEVRQMMRAWNVQISHPRYFGLFNPAPTRPAIVADALTAVYNPQMAAWSHAPAANEIERHTLHHVARKLGLPTETVAANFTSGGSEANHTAVLVALAHHFPQTLEDGLFALSKRPAVYVSELAHNSFDKIVKHVGLGLGALRPVPVDASLRMDVAALKTLLKADEQAGLEPFLVVGTAGVTSTGTIDPLPELAEICRTNGLWFHVDAAWAGAAAFSETLKPALRGIESADSVTVDAHKWFNLTMGAGMFFTPHQESVRAAFNVRADYMPASEADVAVPYLTTLQWSRRFTGLKLFMTLAELGDEAVAAMLDHQAELGHYCRKCLSDNGWIVVNETPLPVVNFTHPAIRSGAVSVETILEKVYAGGDLWISSVTLRGEKAFRFCVTNYKSTTADVDVLMRALNSFVG
ncbi:pyridoxal phosphate-dependent decarboxylase family protein [Tellurirhabdus rosea]|uniref:pyridoxal phosphate-dependent decarboxylase family protein n=1 Tax=Tellurirhabdus rosea TaxID=2674997 RepID=UPI002256B938|nr:aminotransferase class V-fold PLP-dependent enzyme [Tellurirhabdus rosea]